MNTVSLPQYVNSILSRLESAGFSAYAVGGCVRDKLIGRRVNDYDVCTSARPQQVQSLFSHCIPTGIKHGTVSVLSGKHTVEVTTFRTEGSYSDSRHPDSIEFLTNIEDDLARRDFTINAMALDIRGNMIDPFNGKADLAKKVIRCVGKPEQRFSEDALRMLRAVRFSAQLDFEIDDNTLAAIIAQAENAALLSAERVRDELSKLLSSKKPVQLSRMTVLGLLDSFIEQRAPFDASGICQVKNVPLLRWAAAGALLLESGCIASVQEFLKKLRLDGKTVSFASFGARFAVENRELSAVDWKLLAARYGQDMARCAAAAMDALYSTGQSRALNRILSTGECMSLSELAVNGSDLCALGLKGRSVGQVLNELLMHVIVHPEDNSRARLLAIAAQSAHF